MAYWDISSATYSNLKFATAITYFRGVALGRNGTRLYTMDLNSIYEYNLTTPYDISTAVSVRSKSLDSLQVDDYHALAISPNGSKLYAGGDRYIREFSFGSSWNVSTLTLTSSFQVTDSNDILGVTFTSDGKKMYVFEENAGRDIKEYSLTTAWDLTTASYVRTAVYSGSLGVNIFIKPDGKKFYVADFTDSKLYQYSLPMEGNLSSLTAESSLSVNSQPWPFTFSTDGRYFYVVSNADKDIYQYEMTGNPTSTIKEKELKTSWDELTASDSTKAVGHEQTLVPEEGSIVPQRERVGM